MEEIDLKKEELRMSRGSLSKARASVRKYRSELREACIQNNIADSSYFTGDANSSDEEFDDDVNIKGFDSDSGDESDAK